MLELNDINVLSVLVFFILYAEIHFRIPRLPNRLYKKEPEIITDLPHRIEAGRTLPVLILTKDAHIFPVNLLELSVEIINDGQRKVIHIERFHGPTIQKEFWHHILSLNLPPEYSGLLDVDIIFTVEIGGKRLKYRNDNYPIRKRRPFKVFVDSNPLPQKNGWYFGDLHYHSHFTNDQVEFGAPPEVAVKMAKAMGLSFFAVTDHSYDLDDEENNYLLKSHALPKWIALREITNKLNKTPHSVKVIQGEELSVGNIKNRNIHMLILNEARFYHGSGDSAEEWFKVRPEWKISDVLERLSQQALAIAAHPQIKPPFFQRLIFNRDRWREKDCQHERLQGLQIWNGKADRYFNKSIKSWTRLLLKGHRVSIFAGNDAHGNFGRFRQLNIPFINMRDTNTQLFGQTRTGIHLREKLTVRSILTALRKGRCIITDGPFAEMTLSTRNGDNKMIGDIFRDNQGSLEIEALSSPAFGSLKRVILYVGDVDYNKEKKLEIDISTKNEFSLRTVLHQLQLPRRGYLRLRVITSRHGQIHKCLTNPIYIDCGLLK